MYGKTINIKKVANKLKNYNPVRSKISKQIRSDVLKTHGSNNKLKNLLIIISSQNLILDFQIQ